MKNMIYALLVIAFLPMELYSQIHQGSLNVTIENAEEEGILYAQVAVYQGETLITGGVTDPFGPVQIPSIDPGTYEVEITYLGYKTIRKENVEIRESNILRIFITMKPSVPETHGYIIHTPLEPMFSSAFGCLSSWSTEEILKMPVR